MLRLPAPAFSQALGHMSALSRASLGESSAEECDARMMSINKARITIYWLLCFV